MIPENFVCSDFLNILTKKYPSLENFAFSENDYSERATQEAIILENIYKNLLQTDPLKQACLSLRTQRWSENFGVPSVEFLLTYTKLFNTIDLNKLNSVKIFKSHFIYDTNNQVLIDPNIFLIIPLPEQKNYFIPTHNPMGGFTTSYCDPFSHEFIKYATVCAKNDIPVLDIASGFGVATLSAIETGVTVISNDIAPENLSVTYQLYKKSQSITKGILKLFPAMFPEEFNGLANSSIGAILICRLLHFFTGEKIIQALIRAKELLVPGGKIFIVAETPYLKNWLSFSTEYKQRCLNDEIWPGEINNPSKFETAGYNQKLPNFMHLLDKEVLVNALEEVGFSIEKVGYIDRRETFPENLTLDGRESIGIIGVKVV